MKTSFSQFKYAAGGKLDAANYSTARGACLVQRAVGPAHHSGKGYRDMPLDTLVPNLEKRYKLTISNNSFEANIFVYTS